MEWRQHLLDVIEVFRHVSEGTKGMGCSGAGKPSVKHGSVHSTVVPFNPTCKPVFLQLLGANRIHRSVASPHITREANTPGVHNVG